MKRAALLIALLLLPWLAACGRQSPAPYAVEGVMQGDATVSQVRISSDYSPSSDTLPAPTSDDEIQALLGALDPSAALDMDQIRALEAGAAPQRILDPDDGPAAFAAQLDAPLDLDPDQWEPSLKDQFEALGRLMAEHPQLAARVTAFDPRDLGRAQLRAEAVQQYMAARWSLAPQRILAMGLDSELAPGRDPAPGLSIELRGMLRPQRELAQGTAPEERSAGAAVLRFDSGVAQLDPAMLGQLESLARALAADPGAALRVEGHSDDVGSRESNRCLSRQRAQTVKELLVSVYGVDPERIFAIGFGEERPVADNDTEAGRSLNRRVEVTLAPDAMVLPETVAGREFEIEVSISSCRLWLYISNPDGTRSLARTYDVATAGEGVPVPYGEGFITGIDFNPWWYPTASMINRAQNQGRTLVPVPPGSSANPMGAFKIHLSHGGADGAFRIHGTNRPAQIGSRVSLGCVRMHNDEGLQLAHLVHVGTPVTILP